MKIIWSPLAVEQVSDIASYIALDKASAAEQWADKNKTPLYFVHNNDILQGWNEN